MNKSFIYFVLFLFAGIAAQAQAPQALNYQGVARSTAGVPLVSTPLGLRLTIHDVSAAGTVLYQETQTPVTNSFGLYNVAIGTGTVVSGTFNTVNWGTGAKFLQVEIDPAGGVAYADAGTGQLLSVPYAVFANSAATANALTGTVAMGGDVTGTNTAATVVKLNGNRVSSAAPSSGQVLTWNSGSSTWEPATPSSSGTVTSISTAAPLSGGPITTTGTISLSTSGVTAGTYGSATQVPTIAVDAWGRVTSAVNTPITTGVAGTTNYMSKFTSATAIGNSQMFDNGTSVGLGTITPTASNKLQVVNASTATNQHGVHGISGTAATGSITVASGIYGESNAGIGVSGVGEANDGVFGYSTSGTSAGVEGYNSTAGGAGVRGGGDPAGSFGGYFSGGTAGYGLVVDAGLSGFGTVTPGAMVHVNGSKDLSLSLGGISFGHQAFVSQTGATATSSVANAVIGFSGNSTLENHGLHGYTHGTSATAYNVGAFCSGSSGVTTSGNSYGVYGSASGGTINYGIYGTNSGTGYAGYFAGNVYISGSIAKGSGTFRIDHPLDPENKELYHSFVESPDMMNIYNGNVVTDGNGDATVQLPDYFDALNKDFRYQLTTIGSFAQAMISEKVNGNKFSIKTNQPNVEVSWMITGVRQDKFANAHRVVPEVEKDPQFKGHYIHAKEWGMPDSKSYEAVTRPVSVDENGNLNGYTEKTNVTPNPASANIAQPIRPSATGINRTSVK